VTPAGLKAEAETLYRCEERYSRNSEEIRRAHEGVVQPLWVRLIPQCISGVRNSILARSRGTLPLHT